MKTNTYELQNIHCPNCSIIVEEKISKLNGISNCQFNYIFQKLSVTFDEQIINEEQIESTIHKFLIGVKIIKKNNLPFTDKQTDTSLIKRITLRRKK